MRCCGKDTWTTTNDCGIRFIFSRLSADPLHISAKSHDAKDGVLCFPSQSARHPTTLRPQMLRGIHIVLFIIIIIHCQCANLQPALQPWKVRIHSSVTPRPERNDGPLDGETCRTPRAHTSAVIGPAGPVDPSFDPRIRLIGQATCDDATRLRPTKL